MKRRANVTVDAEILAKAKAFGIGLSETLDTALRQRVKDEEARRWHEDNKDAIDAFSRYVEEHGTFAEQLMAEEAGISVHELTGDGSAGAPRRKASRRT